LVLHIAGGSVGLLLFWVPMLSRKGSRAHRNSGRWYSRAMMLVAMSALALGAVIMLDPVTAKAVSFGDPQVQAEFVLDARMSALFLMQLAVLLFANLHYASWVLKVRARRELLRTPAHLLPLVLLILMSLLSGVMGVLYDDVLLPCFAAVGLFTVISNWRYLVAETIGSRGWLLAHVRNIIPSGIAAYTAFFVVGASDWISESPWRLLPWVLPGVIGTVVIFVYSWQLRRQGNPGDMSGQQLYGQNKSDIECIRN
jgi:hypothetical protein